MSSSGTDLVDTDTDLDNITMNERALQNFLEYLQIPSVHPNVNYEPCVSFLKRQAAELELPCKVVTVAPKKPVVIITWPGKDPELPTLLLNSHMDVVPVTEDKWTYPPFIGEEHNGKIYARGAQDMKCIGIQYMEAIRRLQANGVQLERTVHCSFVPDEEIGGANGMKKFVHTPQFYDLNVGVALDEGMPSNNDTFLVYYGERCMWHVTFHCPGHPGHGSLLHENTAAEKLRRLLDKIMDYRATQTQLLKNNSQLTIGDVMTLNVTILNGGQQANVLPSELTMTMDCRIPVTINIDDWSNTLDAWCNDCGDGIYMKQARFENADPTELDDSNLYWNCFKGVIDKMGLKIETRIFPGGTDSRFLRELGIPAFGFSPIINHPVLLHDNDEYLTSDMFLKGIDVYADIITALGNMLP